MSLAGFARLLKSFRFRVFTDLSCKAELVKCNEISGDLGLKRRYATYRSGNSFSHFPMQIMGIVEPSNLTFKYGMLSASNTSGTADQFEENILMLHNWVQNGAKETDKLDSVVIVLYHDDGKTAAAAWQLKNVWPVSYKGPALNAQESKIAFEEIEVCYEDIERIPVSVQQHQITSRATTTSVGSPPSVG